MASSDAPFYFSISPSEELPLRMARAREDGKAMARGIEYSQPWERDLFGPYETGCGEGRQCFDLAMQQRKKGQMISMRMAPEIWPHAGEPYYRVTASAIIIDWETGDTPLLTSPGVPSGGVSWPELVQEGTGWHARSKSEYNSVDVWTDELSVFAGPFDFDLDFSLRLGEGQVAPFTLFFGTMGSLRIGLEYLPGPPSFLCFYFAVSGHEGWIDNPGSHCIFPDIDPLAGLGAWRNVCLRYRCGDKRDLFTLLVNGIEHAPVLYSGDWPRWHGAMPSPALRLFIEQLNDRASPDIDSIVLTRR